MKNIFRTLDNRVGTLLVIIILSGLLAMAPLFYGSLLSHFAMLDQHMLFNVALLVAVLGLVLYVGIQAKRVLHIPYTVSSLIFGIAGFTFWNTLVPINENVYLILGVIASSIVMFRRGLVVDITGNKRTFWAHIFVGALSALALFIITSFFIKLAFPDLSEALRYSSATIMLMLGAHLHAKTLNAMGVVRFSYDMTLLVIFYNFLLFSSRILPDSLINIFTNYSLYSSAINSTALGILVGLIGAYMLHRHKSIWVMGGEEKNENLYTVTLLAGILALSFVLGANPFLAAGVMGLLVTIRDAKYSPEEHILSRFESVVTVLVFLVLGASIPLDALIALAPFGTVVTLFITIVSMIGVTAVFYFFGKTKLMPHAGMRAYVAEVYNRKDAAVLVGALTLFASNYLRFEYMLLIALTVIFVVALEYIYPYILRLVSRDAIK